jgi:fructose-specific phosphotransferase system IIA component
MQRLTETTMEMIDVFSEDLIDLSSAKFKNKEELFCHMTKLLMKAGCLENESDFLSALYERENEGSTYVGNGIAIPHGKSDTVKRASAAFCRCSPLYYESNNDSGEVSIVFVLAVPKQTKANVYIKMLSNISRLLLNERFVTVLKESEDKNEIMEVYREEIKKLPILR